MNTSQKHAFSTPFELGNKNQTTSLAECIPFYQQLALAFPQILRFEQIGVSDNHLPMYAGVVTADGIFDRAQLKAEKRPIFFNNNGIHPGEPEGIDACMALVRDFCLQPERLAALGKTVFLFNPVYNVDGSMNRQNTSRVNQDGPEQFGFRANGRNLDLNRDFIKCASLASQVFNQFFTAWDPDVMVDTHTSNGADYSYTMTLIHTQPDKLGDGLGPFLRQTMLPAIYAKMDQRGWPTCPYVNPIDEIPDYGIEDFLELPRFSTGYAALHHTIGFMPETHMLKPYADRYASMRSLVEVVLDFTIAHADQIQNLRAQARLAATQKTSWPVHWKADHTRRSSFRFKGYQAQYTPSKIGNYTRLSYDRSQPWEKDIPYFDTFVPNIEVQTPKAYLIPQAWREVIARLQWNGVQLEKLTSNQSFSVQSYHIRKVKSRKDAFEGCMFHDEIGLATRTETIHALAGDYVLHLNQENARYAVETLEPQGHDSFFRWGFFNSVLEKKEAFSPYVFEDSAFEMLNEEPELKHKFDLWKEEKPDLLNDQQAVLNFIFTHGKRFQEPEWCRYPVYSLL